MKDLRPSEHSLGGDATYHLGITYEHRRKKLAFHTVQMLSELLSVGTLTVADSEATVTVTRGEAGELYEHLFKRPDGGQVLFVYDKHSRPVVQVTLQTAGRQARKYKLDGKSALYPDFDGRVLRDIKLVPGTVGIFKIDP